MMLSTDPVGFVLVALDVEDRVVQTDAHADSPEGIEPTCDGMMSDRGDEHRRAGVGPPA